MLGRMVRFLALSALLGACGTSAPPLAPDAKLMQPFQAQIDRLHFSTASTAGQEPPPAIVDLTVTGEAARAVYALTLTLPPPQTDETLCPVDYGITWQLDFYAGNERLVTGSIDVTGCQDVSLNAATRSAGFSADEAYWAPLADDLGVPESAIFPYIPH